MTSKYNTRALSLLNSVLFVVLELVVEGVAVDELAVVVVVGTEF